MSLKQMTKEEITENQEKLGKIHHKIVINFGENGVGVDTSETGASKDQMIQAALSLLAMLSREDYCHYISVIDGPDIIKSLSTAFKKLDGKREDNGVQE